MISERHGPSAAKSAKACLSGMFRLAIDDGAIPTSPVRDSSARISVSKKSPRALTPEETVTLVSWLRANGRAIALDIPDLVDWMLATGCRIGEGLALRRGSNSEGKSLLDLEAKTWEVNATVIRVPKTGLVIQPRPKTAAGWRVVAGPDFAVEMVRSRPIPSAGGVLFTSPQTSALRVRLTLPAIYDGCWTRSTATRVPVLGSSSSSMARPRRVGVANACVATSVHGHGSRRTSSGRRSRLGLMRPASRPARSPTNSVTPTHP